MRNTNPKKRCILLARAAHAGQDDSVEDQIKLLGQFASDHDMICVDEIRLHGVPKTTIDDLIRRKREDNNFDALLIRDTGRLSRVPAVVYPVIERLKAAGVELITPEGNDSGDSECSWIERAIQFHAAATYRRAHADDIRRGLLRSIESGRIPHATCTPFGVDRLHVSSAGDSLYILRKRQEGTVVQLMPDGEQVIRTFQQHRHLRRNFGHRKQPGDSIRLIPRAPASVAIVRDVFHKHFGDGWGYRRIAAHLNSEGVPSPTQRYWTTTGIRRMVLNSTYIGVGIFSLGCTGMSGTHQPTAAPHRQENRIEVSYPALRRAFVSDELRPLVLAKIARYIGPMSEGGAQ